MRLEATFIKVSELRLGKVVAEDIFANTQYPIIYKDTKVKSEHLRVIELFNLKTLLKREKTYYWKDIIYTIFKFNNMIIVYTNKGRFIFDNEFNNFKKFLNKLEEKNILIYNNKKEED